MAVAAAAVWKLFHRHWSVVAWSALSYGGSAPPALSAAADGEAQGEAEAVGEGAQEEAGAEAVAGVAGQPMGQPPDNGTQDHTQTQSQAQAALAPPAATARGRRRQKARAVGRLASAPRRRGMARQAVRDACKCRPQFSVRVTYAGQTVRVKIWTFQKKNRK